MATNETPPATTTASCFQCRRNPATGGDGAQRGLCQFCILAGEALDAFWQVVTRHCSTAHYGDLSQERTIRLHDAASAAIEEWIRSNVLPPEDHGQAA
jgi:hypothetical protein